MTAILVPDGEFISLIALKNTLNRPTTQVISVKK